MANAYTNKLKKRMPSPGDFDWDDEWHDNEKIDDVMAGALLSQNRILSGGQTSAGTGLQALYADIVAVVAGLRYAITGATVVLVASNLNYIYIDSTGTVRVSLIPPSGEYVPLALIDTNATGVDRLADIRPLAQAVVSQQNDIFINGDMGIDQENGGAAVSVSTTSKYVVDMLLVKGASHAAVVSAQQVPGFGGFTKAAQLLVTTAVSLSTDKNGHGFQEYIEFKDCQLLAGRHLAFKFSFLSNVAGIYSVALVSGNGSNSYVTTFAYTAAGLVQNVSMLIPVPSAKVIEGSNNRGLALYVGVAAVGGKATATLNAWQTGEFYAATTATDWETTLSNYIAWTGLYGGVDIVAAEFPFRHHSQTLALCRRYLQIVSSGGGYNVAGTGHMGTTTAARISVPISQPLRGVPAVTCSGLATSRIYQSTSSTTPTAIAFNAMTDSSVTLEFTITGGTTFAIAEFYSYGSLILDARM